MPEAPAAADTAHSSMEFVPLGVFSRDDGTGEAAVTLPVVPPAKAAKPSRLSIGKQTGL